MENERQIRKLKELDIYPEDGFITLQRRLMEGRSVSKINGETVQMATLKAVSAILIDIHGQHEHQSLLYKKESSGNSGCICRRRDEKTERKKWRKHGSSIKEKKENCRKQEQMDPERAKELAFLSLKWMRSSGRIKRARR